MILAVDTATKWTGLALFDGRSLLAEHGWRSVNTQTVELAPTVAQMFVRANITAADLAAVAVAIGPGSYTGLRISLGFAKGLALANETRLIGVPTLDIVAASAARSDGQLIAVAEAGRTRVCAGAYKWQGNKGWEASGSPEIVSWPELLDRVEAPATIVGEIAPAAAKVIRASSKKLRIAPPVTSVRRAGYLAQIAWLRLRRGRVDDPGKLVPIYLRDPSGAVPSDG